MFYLLQYLEMIIVTLLSINNYKYFLSFVTININYTINMYLISCLIIAHGYQQNNSDTYFLIFNDFTS